MESYGFRFFAILIVNNLCCNESEFIIASMLHLQIFVDSYILSSLGLTLRDIWSSLLRRFKRLCFYLRYLDSCVLVGIP